MTSGHMTGSSLQRAVQLHQSGKLAEALALYRAILRTDPKNFDCLYRQGIALAQMSRFDDAVKWLRKALAVKPGFAQGHLDLGNLYARLGRFREAAASFRAAVAGDPQSLEAVHNLGNALQELGQFDEALACFDKVLARAPDHVGALFNRGNALKALGRFDDAVAAYGAALAQRPDFAAAMNNLGNALLKLRRLDAALEQFDHALALRPDHPEYLNNAGLALDEIGRLDDALARYDRAIDQKPDYGEAFYNRAITLSKLKRWDDALAGYDAALHFMPDHAEAHNNRGLALQDLKRWDEALACYDRALRLRPDYANARWNRAFCRLLLGDFARGWDGFEQRLAKAKGMSLYTVAPEWDGRKLDGSLLVLKEQGVGDEIFYAGMLNDLRPLARRITVCVDPRLVALYRRSFDGIDVICPDDLAAAGPFDAQVLLGSLGQYLRKGRDAFAHVAPYLRADAARAQALRDRIGVAGHVPGRQLCGLSWVSRNETIGADKSLHLADLGALLARPDMAFVDLQYGDTRAEQEALRAETGLGLIAVPEVDNFNDLDGLAALITACDRVITVSNTTAHLAAALGKPVIVLLSWSPGLLWYWHIDRADSPWYPTVRLLRQETAGDWGAVVARLVESVTAT